MMTEDAEPSQGSDLTSPYGRLKRRLLVGLIGAAALLGVLGGCVPEGESSGRVLDVLTALAVSFLILLWCSYDAAERGYRMSRQLKTVIVLIFIIGLPAYLIKTRGRAGIKSVGLAFAFFVLLCVIAGLAMEGTLAVRHLGWLGQRP